MDALLERQDELDMLRRAVEEAISGRGCLILLAGEAGIGKTSLVRALRAGLPDGVGFLLGACEPLSVPVPLAPMRELFTAASAGAAIPAPLADGGDLSSAGEDRLAVADRLTRALGARAPAVAVIEDAHWADVLTLDLLRMLSRRVEEMGVVLIVTYRDDELAANPPLEVLVGDLATRPAVRRLVPRPLSEAAIRALAGTSPIDSRALARASGGNPFLVVESISAAGGVPASVREAALARAARLSPPARRAVDAAAVIGARVSPQLLEAVVPGSGGPVEEAIARGVLVADGSGFGFRHELIRAALEDSIPPHRRASLHAAVVGALSGSGDFARLAHHAELGGLAAEGCRYAMRAAEEAGRIGALREVGAQAQRALRLGSDLSAQERFALLIRYSRAANFSITRLEEAAEAAEAALEVARQLRDRAREGQALVALAWALWSLDRMVEGRAAAERAVALLEPGQDLTALAEAHSIYVRMEATAFDPAAAIAAGARALELAAATGGPETRIDIEISLALARGHRGDTGALDALADTVAEARTRRLSIPTVRGYVNLVFLAMQLRQHELVDRVVPEALELFDQYGATIPGYAIELFGARSLFDRGEWKRTLAIVARYNANWASELSLAHCIRGLIAARRGEPGAEELLADAWREILTVPEGSRHGAVRAARIEAAWLRGDHGAARAHLREAIATPEVMRFARSGAEVALWAARYGMSCPAPAAAPPPVALELRGDWRGARRAWRELDAPYEAALAALPGDEPAAREAVATLQQLGAAAAARAFARERAAQGAPAPRGPRRSTRANAAGLTRREQEVLEQLAGGHSNPAIAAALHLSERTVAHHVSAVLGKLGASNRLAAVERGRALGLLAQDGPAREQT